MRAVAISGIVVAAQAQVGEAPWVSTTANCDAMASEGEGRPSMLASLLPGLRDVRAPLAAGFIWMVAVWFLLEPHWPEGDTGGVVGSANRLLANLSLLGQGVVLSFTAYVLGSFSVFLFS